MWKISLEYYDIIRDGTKIDRSDRKKISLETALDIVCMPFPVCTCYSGMLATYIWQETTFVHTHTHGKFMVMKQISATFLMEKWLMQG